MALAALPMVELVEVAEGIHDGLEDRFPKIGLDIYTKSIHKNFVKLAQKLLPFATPPVRVSSKRHSCPPPAGNITVDVVKCKPAVINGQGEVIMSSFQ